MKHRAVLSRGRHGVVPLLDAAQDGSGRVIQMARHLHAVLLGGWDDALEEVLSPGIDLAAAWCG